MREQIAATVKKIRYKPECSPKQSWQFADDILTLIYKEIEKKGAIKSYWVKRGSRRPKKEITRLTIADMEEAYSKSGIKGIIEKASELAAQAQLQKILDLLKK